MPEDNSDERVEQAGEVTGIGTDVNNVPPELDVKTVKRQTKMEDIRYALSPDERLVKGEELARLHRKIELLEEEKKASTQHFGALIKAAKGELDIAAEAIRSGHEYRSMAVETIFDYKAGTVTRFLKDSGEELDHRKMTNAEARIEIEITQKKQDEAAEQYVEQFDKKMDEDTVQHMSDCSVNNAPAMEPGPCDCGAEKKAKEQLFAPLEKPKKGKGKKKDA